MAFHRLAKRSGIEAALGAALLAIGCGSSGGSDASPGVGQLLDAAVEGIDYVAGGYEGTTDARGRFLFDPGDVVVFLIGDIEMPPVLAGAVVTPLDMVPGAADETDATVLNIVRFLLTLDADADPGNGMQIPAEAFDLALGMSVDFTDASSVDTALAALTGNEVASDAEAEAHLRATLLCLLAGDYEGTYTSRFPLPETGDSGDWALKIFREGLVLGTIDSDFGDSFVVSGEVDTMGAIVFGTPGAEVQPAAVAGMQFSGEIEPDGDIAGTWDDPGIEDTGSFAGRRRIAEDCTAPVLEE